MSKIYTMVIRSCMLESNCFFNGNITTNRYFHKPWSLGIDKMSCINDQNILPSCIKNSSDNGHIDYGFGNNTKCIYKYNKIYKNEDYFLKGCKWSPDNFHLAIADSKNAIWKSCLSNDSIEFNQRESQKWITGFDPVLSINPGGIVYDFDWGPSISDMSKYGLLTVGSLGPVNLWDIDSRSVISSYMMYDDKDEVISGISVSYSPDNKIYAGTTGAVYIFDTERPGRDCYIVKDKYFKRGMVSTIAINPVRPTLFAIGSYNKKIGLYDERSLLCVFTGLIRGLTHMRFSPDGVLLYSGMRGNGDIICWDLRKPGTALYKMVRTVRTQQRIYFELTKDGHYIISGSTDGKVFIWDTKGNIDRETLLPIKEYVAHLDCTNGISINKRFPLLATTSGQYHYEFPYISDDDSNEWDPADINMLNDTEETIESSIKLWWLGNGNVEVF